MGSNPTPSASILFSTVRSRSNSTAKSVIYAGSSSVLFLIGSLTVAEDRGFGGRFSRRNNGWAAQVIRRRAPNQARQIRRWRWALLDRHRTNIEELVVQILERRQERWHGIGSLKEVSLRDARLARDAGRLRVKGDRSATGVDIVKERRKAREEAKAVVAKVVLPTFEECAEAYIRANWSTWSEKHRDQWPSSLKRYAYATIGKLTIPEIKPSHIHDLLKPIWVEKRETANRVRGRIETIIAKNVDIDNPDLRNRILARADRADQHQLSRLSQMSGDYRVRQCVY